MNYVDIAVSITSLAEVVLTNESLVAWTSVVMSTLGTVCCVKKYFCAPDFVKTYFVKLIEADSRAIITRLCMVIYTSIYCSMNYMPTFYIGVFFWLVCTWVKNQGDACATRSLQTLAHRKVGSGHSHDPDDHDAVILAAPWNQQMVWQKHLGSVARISGFCGDPYQI